MSTPPRLSRRPPELERERGPGDFDPIARGARFGLSRDASLALWQRACRDATGGGGGRLDPAEARLRFDLAAPQIAARGGRLDPDAGRRSLVEVELDGDRDRDRESPDARDAARRRAPGRDTLVAAEARRWEERQREERRWIDPLVAQATAGGGRPLPAALRAEMEAVLGADLGHVRLHDGPEAATATARLGAWAFAHGADVVFGRDRFGTERPADRWLLAHELAHTVQQRGAAPRIQAHDPEASGDASEAAADGAGDRAVDVATATRHNRGLGFGPAAVELLRTTVGLRGRGDLDDAFTTAVRAAVPGSTGMLDLATLRALPLFARPSQFNAARNWYASRDGMWSTMDPAQRTAALTRVVAALGVDATDAAWTTPESGAPRLVVTQRFVRCAVAWQIWQRSGMALDGQLGATALTMLGVATDGRAAERVSFDPTDGARRTTGTSFGERVEAVVGAGSATRLRGEAAPEVGIGESIGGLSPAAFVEAMYGAHADLVTRALFPDDTAAHSLADALGTLGLTAGATRRLSELSGTAGFRGLMALIATPESQALQHELFRTRRVAPALDGIASLGSDASCGTVMLAVLVGTAPADTSSDGAAQISLIRSYLGDDAERLSPYFEALLRREEVAEPDRFTARARTLDSAIRAFLGFWSTPYPGADVDPTTVRSAGTAGATGTTAATGGPSITGGGTGATAPTGPVELHAATGRAAEVGAAMIGHTTGTAALATAYNALHGAVPDGFGADWAAYTASFATIPFLGASVTGHRVFLERLARAEAWLTSQHPTERIRSTVTPTSSASQMREFESAANLSYHHLGLAVDVSAGQNPWIGEGRAHGHEVRASVAAVVTWFAAWVTGTGSAMSAARASEVGYHIADTGAVWDTFDASSGAVVAYFALAGDRAALSARIAHLGAPPAAASGFDTVPGNMPRGTMPSSDTGWTELAAAGRAADVDHWIALIEAQRTAWSAHMGRRASGFMSLERDLVIALRDIGGLAWGACDFGPHSASGGDFMHFDARTIFPYRTFTTFRGLIPAATGGGETAETGGSTG